MQPPAFDRIDVDPGILSGQPVIRGTRLPVYVVVEAIAAGDGVADLLRAFPFVTEEDVRQALGFAAGDGAPGTQAEAGENAGLSHDGPA